MKAHVDHGEEGLINNNKPCPQNLAFRTPSHIEENILYLRRKSRLGQVRISWYLKRQHGIKISSAGVSSVLKRKESNRLPRNARTKHTEPTNRYEKQVQDHHVQVDVNFLKFQLPESKKIRRFQYIAVDDAPHICALKICQRHTQKNASDFID